MIQVFTAQWAQNSSLVFHYFSPSRREPGVVHQSPSRALYPMYISSITLVINLQRSVSHPFQCPAPALFQSEATLWTSAEFPWVSFLYPVILLHSVSFAAPAFMASMPAACFVFRAIFFLFLSECSLLSPLVPQKVRRQTHHPQVRTKCPHLLCAFTRN